MSRSLSHSKRERLGEKAERIESLIATSIAIQPASHTSPSKRERERTIEGPSLERKRERKGTVRKERERERPDSPPSDGSGEREREREKEGERKKERAQGFWRGYGELASHSRPLIRTHLQPNKGILFSSTVCAIFYGFLFDNHVKSLNAKMSQCKV